MVDWVNVFDELHPERGASEADLAALRADLGRGLSDADVASICAEQKNPFGTNEPLYGEWKPFDPRTWSLPNRPLPPVYVDFLRYSNGGTFRTGTRTFDAFLSTREIRSTLIGYWFPEFLPGALPFAFDGSGGIYAFDTREEARDGEYPVLFCMAGAYFHDEALLAGSTFLEACSGRTEPPLL